MLTELRALYSLSKCSVQLVLVFPVSIVIQRVEAVGVGDAWRLTVMLLETAPGEEELRSSP